MRTRQTVLIFIVKSFDFFTQFKTFTCQNQFSVVLYHLCLKSSAAVAQSVERILGKDEVTGSNPVSSCREHKVNMKKRSAQMSACTQMRDTLFSCERMRDEIKCEAFYELRRRRFAKQIVHFIRVGYACATK